MVRKKGCISLWYFIGRLSLALYSMNWAWIDSIRESILSSITIIIERDGRKRSDLQREEWERGRRERGVTWIDPWDESPSLSKQQSLQQQQRKRQGQTLRGSSASRLKKRRIRERRGGKGRDSHCGWSKRIDQTTHYYKRERNKV